MEVAPGIKNPINFYIKSKVFAKFKLIKLKSKLFLLLLLLIIPTVWQYLVHFSVTQLVQLHALKFFSFKGKKKQIFR